MCDPLTIAALAATAGGAFMQNKANQEVSSKRNQYSDAERGRQEELSRQANVQFKKSLANQTADTQKQQITEQKQTMGQMLNDKNVSGEGSYLPSQADAPAIVRQMVDTKAQEAVAKNTQRGTALGNLLGYSNQGLTNALGFTRSGENIANLSNNMQGSAGVLPLEMQAANSAGAKSRMWGDILTGAGQIASFGSMAGAGPSWGSLGFSSSPKIINAGALKTIPVQVSDLPVLA